ncbi:hypothetical protein [Actinomadura oligospora]|uniref:hypothetical protein n=1 Tax=Actinomadura oligospora TaxID=111804 RepID=UPI0004B098F9|nr:hypothetical protein [Actinomadura oligospora]
MPYLLLEFDGTVRACPPPREVAGIWRDEFDAALEEGVWYATHAQIAQYVLEQGS